MRAVVIAQATRRKQPGPSAAWRLYQGSQQQLVQAGLAAVWERYGFRQLVDERILSPWHGPVAPDEVLAPYDFSWKGRPRGELAALVAERKVVERLQVAVQGADLVMVLLSKTYLAPLALPQWVPATAPQRWLFFASPEGLPAVPAGLNVRVWPAGMAEARAERVKALDLKAHLFRRLCLGAAAEGEGALERWWAAAQVRRESIL